MRWKTEEMIALTREIVAGMPEPDRYLFSVDSLEADGDVDTEKVIVFYTLHDFVTFCGFHTSNRYQANRSDVEAEMIELLSQHADSRGGVETEHEPLAIFAFRLKKALNKLGWSVVPKLDRYF